LRYKIDYAGNAENHLAGFAARQRRIIADAIDVQLSHDPTVQTRNRKRMRPNALAPWELRIGGFRVYYDVTDQPEPVVQILAIGEKVHNRVRIGREVIEP
jgi:mRNA-degrading endonuclease RelE of RelBE toxin-antitoxin system